MIPDIRSRRRAPRAVLVCGLLISLLTGLPSHADAPARTITVQGTGSIDVVPDMLHLRIGVTQEAETAAAAMAEMAARNAAVLDAVMAMGVAARDIRTGRLSLAPRFIYPDNSAPEVSGFIAEVSLEVRLREFDALARLLDAVVTSGAARIDGIDFDLADPRSVEDLARLAAVADAHARARLYADAAGVALGPVIRIDETLAPGGPTPMFDPRIARAESVTVAPGELVWQAQVTMVFAIAEQDD